MHLEIEEIFTGEDRLLSLTNTRWIDLRCYFIETFAMLTRNTLQALHSLVTCLNILLIARISFQTLRGSFTRSTDEQQQTHASLTWWNSLQVANLQWIFANAMASMDDALRTSRAMKRQWTWFIVRVRVKRNDRTNERRGVSISTGDDFVGYLKNARRDVPPERYFARRRKKPASYLSTTWSHELIRWTWQMPIRDALRKSVLAVISLCLLTWIRSRRTGNILY